jgi:hypothetical protein
MLASVHCVEAFSVLSFALSLELKLNICFWVKSNTCPLCHLLFVLFFAQYPPLSHQEWIRAHNNTLSLWLLNSAPQWRAAMFQHTPLQWHIDCREESRIWGPKVMGSGWAIIDVFRDSQMIPQIVMLVFVCELMQIHENCTKRMSNDGGYWQFTQPGTGVNSNGVTPVVIDRIQSCDRPRE